MANQYKKITDLPSMVSGDVDNSTDLLAIVDISEDETKASTLDTFIISTLNGGTFIGSFSGSFTGDGSGITGVESEWDGSHLGDASITGSFIISGSGTTINFIEVENGVSGSFYGVFSGSFEGDGSGLTGLTAETASYILSSNVDGPHGMDSILTASHAVYTPLALSSSYAISSSQATTSSNALTASYSLGGGSGIWTDEGTYYTTTNDLQVTGSFDVDTPSSEQLIVSGNMGVEGRLTNSGSIVNELGPPLEAGIATTTFLNGDVGGWKNVSTSSSVLLSGSNTYLYNNKDWSTANNQHNQMDISPFTGSEYVGQYIKVWYNSANVGNDNEQACFRFKRGNSYSFNGQSISPSSTITIAAYTPLSGSFTSVSPFGASGSMLEIYCVGEDEYFAVSTGIPV